MEEKNPIIGVGY